MPFVIAALVLVGTLCVLNLLLSVGVIKRLREHTELLSKPGHGKVMPSLGVGEEVGEFLTSTVDGGTLSRESLADDTVVGFFSPNCGPCREQLPRFVEYSGALPGGRGRVVAVVLSHDADEANALVADLAPVASVVVETSSGPLSKAFKIKAYPTVLRVAARGGRLVVTDEAVDLGQTATAVA
ncbi:TlpA disulfide reductase family protein [Streptosporangium sp. NPDC020145]|uniref:TlpA family protein disulfide reductase n=1 Tax=Streptosporangium jomthongense TaxID=1193683 RepID=A0ABV8FF91_9ACTN